jgi:spore coat protein A, manganese oxidase
VTPRTPDVLFGYLTVPAPTTTKDTIIEALFSQEAHMLTRRQFLKMGGATIAASVLNHRLGLWQRVFAAIPGGTLPPADIDKFALALPKPPAMPATATPRKWDFYNIAVRQFQQQILPGPHPATTVWSYGSANKRKTIFEGGSYFYPAFTVEARWNRPVQVNWINGLVDGAGNFLPHLLPIDQTLHWANPPGGLAMRDMRGSDPAPYLGPVPIVTHVHGAHTTEESDGYAEAWYLPDAMNIPAGYATTGTFFDYFNAKYGAGWGPGAAKFSYPNDQRATTLWYHDHTLGMTRANVYAGPAGFWLIRGGPDDVVFDGATNTEAVLPGPAPGVGADPFGTYYEIPIAIQDRSFNADGSLFYPDNRAFFEGLNVLPTEPYLDIPFIPEMACDGLPSDISPIWNPEFFGNTMVVNGQAWPYLDVEQRRYRFRLLNGCNSRFLILKFDHPGVDVWQIGAEGGFLRAPAHLNEVSGGQLLMAPAERADVIVDFSDVPVGTEVILLNLGPDEPFGGGVPGVDFDMADPESTGLVMAFRVGPALGEDTSTPPWRLVLPPIADVNPSMERGLSLNEADSHSVRVSEDEHGNVVFDCASGEPFGPSEALLGTVDGGQANPLLWMDPISENPGVGDTETWAFYNFTMDAHPIHVHQVMFQVVSRQDLEMDAEGMAMQPAMPVGDPRPPEPNEDGWKDTVTAYPGEITRVKMKFDLPGFYVWHCHIVEHEDNEMMRPYHVGPIPPDAPAQ